MFSTLHDTYKIVNRILFRFIDGIFIDLSKVGFRSVRNRARQFDRIFDRISSWIIQDLQGSTREAQRFTNENLKKNTIYTTYKTVLSIYIKQFVNVKSKIVTVTIDKIIICSIKLSDSAR